MIKPMECVLVTFHTTTDAMAMESFCRAEGVDGKLVPVPGFITADCGLAWCAPPLQEEAILELLRRKGLAFQALHHCQI